MNSRAEENIFEAVLALPPEQRGAYLDKECGGDAQLRRRVEGLLQAHERAGEFMAEPAAPRLDPTVRVPVPLTEKPGDRIGHYKLLQEIGEGGCGVVYMAEQHEPIRRKVAFKVIKLGMDTKQVIARFEAERQALALMDHPNIAKVLDAGATDTGRPYFVMELVRGIKITEYCDQNNLTTEERLNLFVQVCHAIQHAHQKGIIHRDIKPSNILVTVNDGVAVPKVIDFGIAKATGGQVLTDKTLFTAFEQFIGTPAYMSPEQAEMTSLDIDTRSDIYALGVLLYELLTGHTPFDPKTLVEAGLDEMRRIIREREPPRPSTRLSSLAAAEQTTVASRRHTEPPKLIHQVRGDLDWIVMKCLEKDRTRRYETANRLATDVVHHLNNEPVTARPPNRLYRFRKLVRRNKLVFAAVGAVAAALIIGLGLSTWLFFREREARQVQTQLRQQAQAEETKARTEAEKRRQVAQFLKDMLEGVGPSVALGRDTKMLREILDKTAARVATALTNQPEVGAELRGVLGGVYLAVGEYNAAEGMYQEVLTTERKLRGPEHPDLAAALDNLGLVYQARGKLGEAESMHRQALSMRRKLLGNEHLDVATSLNNLALVLCEAGRLAEAETMRRDALAMTIKFRGAEHADVAISLNCLAQVLWREAKLVEAEATQREALRMQRKVLGAEHPDIVVSLSNLGAMLVNQGKFAEAEALHGEALAMSRKLLGNEHPDTLTCLNNLAQAVVAQDRLAEAESLNRDLLTIRRKVLGSEHPHVAVSMHNLALVFANEGKLAEAERLHRESLQLFKKLRGDEHPEVAIALNCLAQVLATEGRLGEAEATEREALAMQQKLLGAEHPDVATSLNNLANMLDSQGKLAEGERMHREVLTLKRRHWGDQHPDVATALNNLAQALREQGRFSEAESIHREALAQRQKLLGTNHTHVGISLNNLGLALRDQGRLAEAEAAQRQAMGIFRRGLGDANLNLAAALNNLGRTIEDQGNLKEAEALQREALAMRRKLLGEEHPAIATSLHDLGLMLQAAARLPEAEASLREALAMRRKLLGSQDPALAASLEALARLLCDKGQPAEAEGLARQCLAIRQKRLPDDWRSFSTLALLGSTLVAQKRNDEAEPLLRSAWDGLRALQPTIPAYARQRSREPVLALVQIYESTGRPDQAAEWRKKLGPQ